MPSDPQFVHPVPLEELGPWVRAMASTFLNDPHGPSGEGRLQAMRRLWNPERAWGVKDGPRWAATLRTEHRILTVPGLGGATHDLTVDAVTNVTVSGTHRRQGWMSRMITDSLRAAKERGDPLSMLLPAEWPIYGRFGYAPATVSADYTLRRSRRGSAIDGDLTRVRQVEREEFGVIAPAVYDAARRGRAGQVDRGGDWWPRNTGLEGYVLPEDTPHNWLVHDGDDGPDGLLTWTARGEFELVPPYGQAEVYMAAASDGAYRDLWSFASGIDIVDDITLMERPVDEPARFMLADGRTLVQTGHVDFVWVRLLDVPAALSARRYSVPGDLVLEVTDPGGFAAGRFRLTADGEEVACVATGDCADLTITHTALASIYLGGFRLSALPGAAEEHTAAALTRLDLMCSTALAPWNATWF